MDLNARRIVGWDMADPLKANLCLDALAMALSRRANIKGLIHSEHRVLVMPKTQLTLAIHNNTGPPMRLFYPRITPHTAYKQPEVSPLYLRR
jgi:transposase InsO family protein